MGFLSSLGSSIVNTAKQSAKQGVVNGILSASKGSYGNYLGNMVNGDGYDNQKIYTDNLIDMSNSEKYVPVSAKSIGETAQEKYAKSKALCDITHYSSNKRIGYEVDDNYLIYNDTLKLPNWGYDVFINERTSFQKGLAGPLGDPGFFYFKIFFNFDTKYGLFGNILNNSSIEANPYWNSVNTAITYLYMCHQNYKQERIADRMDTLVKFTKILSFINSQSPWFFKGIHGLDKANVPVMNEFNKERSIEIECLEDAIDMRLTTLMDLYKHSVYDDYHCKEIIPENLRKFDMSILLFASPIKYLHTAFGEQNIKPVYGYKGFSSNDYENMPSFKLYTFMNCEFDLESIGAMIPSSMTNDNPFQLGKNKIKINYDRVVTHTMNEFNKILFGTTGVYFDRYYEFVGIAGAPQSLRNISYDNGTNRLNSLSESYEDTHTKPGHYDSTKNKYSALVDAAEAVTHTNLMKLSGYSLGNIYGQDFKIGSDYWKQKMNWQFSKNISILQDIGTNTLLKLMGSHYNASARLHTSASGEKISEDGWLAGYGPRAVGSQYWKDKVESLKAGKRIVSKNTEYLDQQQRAGNYSFKQSLYNMFRN